MKNRLAAMENSLSSDAKKLLQEIYAPRVVVIPPCDACMSMCVSKSGEIRIYGAHNKTYPEDIGTKVYYSSSDCGLSWETHLMAHNCLGAATYSEKTGRYMSIFPQEYRPELKKYFNESGTFAMFNDEGFDCTNNRFVKMTDRKVHCLKLPYYLESCNRWIILGQYTKEENHQYIPVVLYSDDNGESWTERLLENTAPRFETTPPHKGIRWQQDSCEPTIAELSSGELVMIVRTSQDYYYTYRSKDKGDTWEGPKRSDFHGTITMPVLQKLTDGRIVFFSCNTEPLPELDHEKTWPPVGNDIKKGVWEDVFTNRDANHLAISEDDMQSFIGFRELFLNTIRNNADFRSIGGLDSRDKSVHQGQIIELPFNKLLIHFGQNISARKVVILDINWLYEKERSEKFRFGLGNVSTQMYLHSNLGGYKGFSGHCAYNRTNGALLIPDPAANYREVLQICRVDDPRLVYKKQGVVWNFPADKKGIVEVELKVVSSGVNVCLTDHWFNPCDETVKDKAHITVKLEEKCDWTKLTVKYNTTENFAEITFGEKEYTLPINVAAPNGLCYLHIQTVAETQDFEGTLIKTFDKKPLA